MVKIRWMAAEGWREMPFDGDLAKALDTARILNRGTVILEISPGRCLWLNTDGGTFLDLLESQPRRSTDKAKLAATIRAAMKTGNTLPAISDALCCSITYLTKVLLEFPEERVLDF